ncbi:hypothetical protein [Parahaliea aestuarii]|uniref:PEP-CTERM sorting domain-containing protein n=1 Tax=Parahaliea aestuarii TaxID=1852021 RepID=A0A5C8ZSJ8_9GAMM|nr:hypothetical protein [Parahaliea aestuarii]TXS91493.1 hypothetical protein FVW59_09975 [Parahaliea aestuarii]
MKLLFPALLVAGTAPAANAATWGGFAWGSAPWSSLVTQAQSVPIDSPLFLLGLSVTLASTAIWYLKKQRR